jgi:hypothetical protein
MRLAVEIFDVSIICLSAETGADTVDLVPGGLPLTRVPKPPISRRRLLAGALLNRRSAECRRLLTDRDAGVRAGDHLFDINRQIWEHRQPHRAVEALLRGQDAPATKGTHEVP